MTESASTASAASGASSASAASTPKPTVSKSGQITIFGMVMLNISAVVGLNGLASEAFYGLSSVFYYAFGALLFLVPMGIVAAELATGWPERGGIFRWVGEAFGNRWGFFCTFLLTVMVCITMPASLAFAAVALAYAGPDTTSDLSLGNNKVFVVAVILVVFWGATFIAMAGTGAFARVVKWGAIIGTIIPAVILIVLGVGYIFLSGKELAIPMAWSDVLPDFSNFSNIVLAATVFLLYAGMEMNAIHVKDMKNSTKTYPIAVLISSLMTILIFVIGTLSIAVVVPQKELSLTAGILQAYQALFDWVGIGWAAHVVGPMLAVSMLVGAIAWLAGPSSAMVAVARKGFMPKVFQKTNKHGMAVWIMVIQAIIVSAVGTLLAVMPSVESFFQILTQFANILYLTIYLLMFSSVIVLRYTQPNRPRAFRIPGGIAGVWIFGAAGFLSALTALVFSFMPPGQVSVGSPAVYVAILVGITVVVFGGGLLVFQLRKPTWRDPTSTLSPLTWELEGLKNSLQRTESSVSTAELSNQWQAKHAAELAAAGHTVDPDLSHAPAIPVSTGTTASAHVKE